MFENSDSQLEEIKLKIDIVSLISRYVPLKQAGKNFSGVCPFHSEKTPSFIVSPELQRYKCFGCQKSGDIFTFLMEFEKVDFKEALEKLAKEAGVKLTNLKPKDKRIEILYMINNIALRFYQDELEKESSKLFKEYLYKRGINNELIKTFGIGYAYGNNSLLKYLKSKAHFTNQQLLDSGLFNIERDGKTIKDKFNKRIVFPIHDEKGRIIAYSGRILPGNEFGPKYLNSPETPIYQKRRTLYGIYQSKSSIRTLDTCIICEAQTGVIACHKINIKNIVAPLGTALTPDQLKVIKKFTNKIVFAFDNDTAGQNAVLKGFMMAEELEFESYAINTESYKDIDELVQGDEKKAIELLNNPQDCISYLVSSKLASLKLNNYKDYNTFMNYIKILISKTTKRESLNFIIEKISNLSGIEKQELVKILLQGTKVNTTNDNISSQVAILDNKIDLELKFLSMILNSEKYSILQEFDFTYFLNIEIKHILEFIKNLVTTKSIKGISLFKSLSENFTDDIYKIIFEKVYLDKNFLKYSSSDIEKDINTLYLRINEDNKRILIKEVRNKIAIEEAKPEPNQNLIDKYLETINKL